MKTRFKIKQREGIERSKDAVLNGLAMIWISLKQVGKKAGPFDEYLEQDLLICFDS